MTETKHPDPETIAGFAEGKLRRAEIAGITHHLAHCAPCRRALEAANDALAAESTRREMAVKPWWLVAIGIAAIVAILLVSTLPFRGCAVP